LVGTNRIDGRVTASQMAAASLASFLVAFEIGLHVARVLPCYLKCQTKRLEAEDGPLCGPEEIAALTAAFDAALRKLELVDRYDPAAIAIAKLIVIAAKKGEWNPSRLCNHAVTLWRNRWPPQLVH
jgi:hypothetical protein